MIQGPLSGAHTFQVIESSTVQPLRRTLVDPGTGEAFPCLDEERFYASIVVAAEPSISAAEHLLLLPALNSREGPPASVIIGVAATSASFTPAGIGRTQASNLAWQALGPGLLSLSARDGPAIRQGNTRSTPSSRRPRPAVCQELPAPEITALEMTDGGRASVVACYWEVG